MPSASCTRTLDFDALVGDDAVPDAGTAPTFQPEALLPSLGLDGGFSCRTRTPPVVFCDDFESEPLEAIWDEVLSAPRDGGVVAREPGDSVSPRTGLRVSVAEGIPAGTYVSMGLHEALPASAASRTLAIDFDLKVEALDPKPGRDIVAFQLLLGDGDGDGERDGERNQLVLDLQSAGGGSVRARFNENLLAADGSSLDATLHELAMQPVTGSWAHVSFLLDVRAPSGGKNQVALRIGPRDGAPSQAVKLFEGPLKHALRGGQPHMEVGIPWLSTAELTAPWRIRYDNVLVRIREE
ncbi:MAG: hypothetical protein ABW252_23905 [Polyangiales bacterium]